MTHPFKTEFNKARIRQILLDNGFTIKPGESDLKPYVYEAVMKVLIESGFPRVPLKPAEVADLWNKSGQNITKFARAIEQRCKPQQAPVAWPRTPADVRRFLANNYECIVLGDENGDPNENDKYGLSAHDLLSAFSEWVDFGFEPEPQPQQEPVAWISKHGVLHSLDDKDEVHPINELQPLYTFPPKRQPLTDEQIHAVRDSFGDVPIMLVAFARAIEAAHGIGG